MSAWVLQAHIRTCVYFWARTLDHTHTCVHACIHPACTSEIKPFRVAFKMLTHNLVQSALCDCKAPLCVQKFQMSLVGWHLCHNQRSHSLLFPFLPLRMKPVSTGRASATREMREREGEGGGRRETKEKGEGERGKERPCRQAVLSIGS